MRTVNLRPTPGQYEGIARHLIVSTAADVTDPARRVSAARVLSGLIELVAYLATLPDGAERIARLQAFTERNA